MSCNSATGSERRGRSLGSEREMMQRGVSWQKWCRFCSAPALQVCKSGPKWRSQQRKQTLASGQRAHPPQAPVRRAMEHQRFSFMSASRSQSSVAAMAHQKRCADGGGGQLPTSLLPLRAAWRGLQAHQGRMGYTWALGRRAGAAGHRPGAGGGGTPGGARRHRSLRPRCSL
jgi:hypothetical protein